MIMKNHHYIAEKWKIWLNIQIQIQQLSRRYDMNT